MNEWLSAMQQQNGACRIIKKKIGMKRASQNKWDNCHNISMGSTPSKLACIVTKLYKHLEIWDSKAIKTNVSIVWVICYHHKICGKTMKHTIYRPTWRFQILV